MRVAHRQRRCRARQQPHPQTGLLHRLPQRRLGLRFVPLDMPADDHVPAQTRLRDQAEPPSVRELVKHKSRGRGMLDHQGGSVIAASCWSPISVPGPPPQTETPRRYRAEDITSSTEPDSL